MSHLTFSNPSLHVSAAQPLMSVILLGQSATCAAAARAPAGAIHHPEGRRYSPSLLFTVVALAERPAPLVLCVVSLEPLLLLAPLLLHFFSPSPLFNNLSLSLFVDSETTRKYLCKILTPNLQSYLFLQKLSSICLCPVVLLAVSCCLAPWRAPTIPVKDRRLREAKSLAQSCIGANERAGTPQSSVQSWSSCP